jgi:hypothetical protein
MRSSLIALTLLAALPARAADPPPKPPGIDPRAAAELRRMSDYVSGLQSFRVESAAADEVVLKSGEKQQSLSDSQLAVKRPNMLRSDRLGPLTEIVFRYDGKSHLISLYGKRTGYYATAPAPATLDAAIDDIRPYYYGPSVIYGP